MRVNTLKKFDELRASGVSEDQARVIAQSLADASETDMTEIATKSDIRDLQTITKSDIRDLQTSLAHIEKVMYSGGLLVFSCLGYLMFVK